jgi:hypothetical protein
MKRGRKSDPYTTWLCYQLACVVDEYTEFLPQHKGSSREGAGVRGYANIGRQLGMTADAVEWQVGKARERRGDEKGMQEYLEWLRQRETRWWIYHVKCIENRDLKLLEYVDETEGNTAIPVRTDQETLRFTPKEVETLINEALKLLEANSVRSKHDYKDWLSWFEKRDEKGRSKPLAYHSPKDDEPVASSFLQRRSASGLRNRLGKAGRPRKKPN